MEKEKDRKKVINIDIDEDADEEAADEDTNDSNSENSNVQNENGNATTKKNKKIKRALRGILSTNDTKFMSNFDPELSNRERRKLTRKFNAEGKKNGSSVDENGTAGGSEKDVCDCLTEDCPGCHFPCPKCRSCKCAVECRVNRKWAYEVIENETDLAAAKNGSVAST